MLSEIRDYIQNEADKQGGCISDSGFTTLSGHETKSVVEEYTIYAAIYGNDAISMEDYVEVRNFLIDTGLYDPGAWSGLTTDTSIDPPNEYPAFANSGYTKQQVIDMIDILRGSCSEMSHKYNNYCDEN